MTPEDVKKIIDMIPQYIKYIYPGYLTIYMYCFTRGKTVRDSKGIIVKSIAISYIYVIVLDAIAQLIDLSNITFSREVKENIALIIIAIFVSYISYRVVISENTQNALGKFKIQTTFYDNEMEMLADFNKGAWLCIYLNDDNVVYEGSLARKELEDGKRKYITLQAFYKYHLNEQGKPKAFYIEDHKDDYKQEVLIFYDSIKRIEKR